MIERRTGKSVVDDVNSIVNPTRESRPLPTVDLVGPLPVSRGIGVYQAPAAGGGTGGGIASPLTEVPGSREYYASTVVIPSVDGSSYMAIQVPARIRMTDANGTEVVFQYRQVP